MPAPAFKWSTVEVRVSPSSPLRALAVAPDPPAAPEAVKIPLPNLTDWPSPLDKAKILLESAAEVEHALMVQYLYAAYSLKSSEEVTDPAQVAVLDETSSDSWPHVLLGIAREEMGHLMTVQNLLLLLGLPPNLEREDFPPRKDLYPFAVHLEPLSQRSLAKYVVAEAPANAEGIDDYRGRGGMAAFPAPGAWVPTREVPTDPKVDVDITEPRMPQTRRTHTWSVC